MRGRRDIGARMRPSCYALFAVIAVGLCATACSSIVQVPSTHVALPPEQFGRTFTTEEIEAEVDDLLDICEDVHPDLYFHASREDVERARDEFIASIDAPLTRVELQPRLARLAAHFGDGHTNVGMPWEEWWAHAEAGRVFPCDVAWDGHTLRVRRTSVYSADGSFAPGARILSIAEHPAADLFTAFMQERSGETAAFRADQTERTFPLHLWMSGIEAPYSVRFEPAAPGSTPADIHLPGMAWGSVARGAGNSGNGAAWSLTRLDDGAAHLRLRSLTDLDAFEDFLAATFGELSDDPPTGLIVDLRENGGGDSRLGDALLDHLSDEPWRQHLRKEWKVSARYKQFLRRFAPAWLRWLPLQYLHADTRKLWGTPEGELAVFDYELTQPTDEPLRYRGPTVFLIGPGTFSSATSLAAAVKDHRLALLMGRPTGGLPGGYGEVYPFDLPRTGLAVSVSSARFVRPSGATTGRGVQPDIVVPPAPDGTRDAVLQRAQAWVAEQSS